MYVVCSNVFKVEFTISLNKPKHTISGEKIE